MNHLKITIITAVFNAEDTVEDTIKSVLNQSYPNIEYIIIDGGSTDGTVDIIKKYKDLLSYWVSEPDKGVYDAMNKGVDKATGAWINFMNSGDSFYDNDILKTIFFNNDYFEVDVIYGDYLAILSFGQFLVKAEPLEILNHRTVFCHQTVFISSIVHKKYLFDLQYRIAADYNLFYTLYNAGYAFNYIPLCIAKFDAINGLSSKNISEAMIENQKINQGSLNVLKFQIFRLRINQLLRHIIPVKLYNDIRKRRLLKKNS